MTFEIFFTFILLIAMTVALAKEVAPAEYVIFGTLMLFMVTGIVTPESALSGFANAGILVIGALFIVSAGIENTHALNRFTNFFVKDSEKTSLSKNLLKMMFPVTTFSAFMNNTPLVMIFIPVVKKWAEKINVSASKFFIPLSYAAIFGGMCTVIGTSTNLVAHGMMLEAGFKGIGFFELSVVGIPCAIAGWVYLAFFGHKLLPENKDPLQLAQQNSKEYCVEMSVEENSSLVGKEVGEAGLRNLKGLYLMDIERHGSFVGLVSAYTHLEAGDRLFFVGVTSAVMDLQKIPGLVPAVHGMFEKEFFDPAQHVSVIEAVVSTSAPFLNRTAKSFGFRKHYGAGILAVHRNGERIKEKIGSIKLKAGDTLLLYSTENFFENWKDSQDFFLISEVEEKRPGVHKKSRLALLITGLMILGSAFGGFLPKIGGQQIGIIQCSVVAAILMFLTQCVKRTEAAKSVKWDVLITIGASIGVAHALQDSGTADFLAAAIIYVVDFLGPKGALFLLYGLTILFSAVITNVAAVAIFFPIALSLALKLGVNPQPFFIAITIAASASFATPIGYQTNLIVQGVGGYRFKDYLKVGVPLTLIFFVISSILIPLFWSF